MKMRVLALLMILVLLLVPACAVRLQGDVELSLTRKRGTRGTTTRTENTVETSMEEVEIEQEEEG